MDHARNNAKIHYPKQIVRLELYRLAACFYSSKRFRDLSDGSDYCPYQPLRDEFERSEIARILLLVASAGRLICDEIKTMGEEPLIKANLVGVIQDNVRTEEDRDLNVLEVFSKILHAKLILPTVHDEGNPYREYLGGEFTLYSDESRKIGWKATVSVDKFVAAVGNIAE